MADYQCQQVFLERLATEDATLGAVLKQHIDDWGQVFTYILLSDFTFAVINGMENCQKSASWSTTAGRFFATLEEALHSGNPDLLDVIRQSCVDHIIACRLSNAKLFDQLHGHFGPLLRREIEAAQ